MAYITRELERKFLKLNDFFKVILVTGARQVGKTTMLKHLAGSDRTYVTMDNTMARDLAQSDPVLFFQTYKPPILIDEVQKAPELFEQIKIICDESDEKGLIWLTGSQQYNMMKRVRETLAGRIGILELYSLSAREKAGLVFDTDLNFSLATLQARQRKLPKNDVVQVFNHIWEGGMPQVQGVDDELRLEYFNSYVDTYLMRDATEAGGITDTVRFRRFLVGCASLVSEQVNYSTLAESADIAPSTAKEWLKILVGLNIIYLLAPYSNNELKRLSKTPKLYPSTCFGRCFLRIAQNAFQLPQRVISSAVNARLCCCKLFCKCFARQGVLREVEVHNDIAFFRGQCFQRGSDSFDIQTPDNLFLHIAILIDSLIDSCVAIQPLV